MRVHFTALLFAMTIASPVAASTGDKVLDWIKDQAGAACQSTLQVKQQEKSLLLSTATEECDKEIVAALIALDSAGDAEAYTTSPSNHVAVPQDDADGIIAATKRLHTN